MQAAASKGASSQIQSVCASSFIPDWSRGTNLEDTVSTILLFGKDFESFFLIARSHHTIRYLQMTEFSFHRRRMKGGAKPESSTCHFQRSTEDTALLGSACVLQQQKHCYRTGLSPANKSQQSTVSSWQQSVKSTPHPSKQNGTYN